MNDTYWYDNKLPDGVTYDRSKNQYVLSASYGSKNRMFDFDALPEKTTTVDASAVQSSYFSIWGDNRDNTIIASRSGGYIHTGTGCDKVYFGEGEDKLGWSNFYEGEITVYGYKKGQDRIELDYGDSVSRYEIKGNDLILWNEGQYRSSKLTLKNTKLTDVTIVDWHGNEVTNWQQSANIVSESRNLVGDADSASLYFDDDASYVDADSMKLEAVSRNHDSLASQKEFADLVLSSGDVDFRNSGMLTAGSAAAEGSSRLGNTETLGIDNGKSDDLLGKK